MIGDRINSIASELPPQVTLVAVSKFHSVSEIMQAYVVGQRDFGENRPQELEAKYPQLPSDIRWHFIGHLQTNKLSKVLPYAHLVQSIDSEHLLDAVSKWAVSNGRTVDVLLELKIAQEESKFGFTQQDLISVLSRSDAFPAIRFRGIMAMATNTEYEGVIREEFSFAHNVFEHCKTLFPSMESFNELSIGMSGDWRIALEYGATIVRIGTAIFGPRNTEPLDLNNSITT